MIAFIPDPQTLLTVEQATLIGNGAKSAACLAGACPCPAGKTQPIKSSSIKLTEIPDRSTAALIAKAPKLGADKSANTP